MINIKNSQNFLKSKVLAAKLADSAGIKRTDIVYEIGPGKGILTFELAKRAKKVVAVELDKHLFARLAEKTADFDNVRLINRDFLKTQLPPKGDYVVFSSIPYNITAAIVRKLTSSHNPPLLSFLLMQEQAARKYAGQPYNKERLASLLLKPFYDISIIKKVGRNSFTPVPKVDSALLKIQKKSRPDFDAKHSRMYRDFISFVFMSNGADVKKRLLRLFSSTQLRKLAHSLKFGMNANVTEIAYEQWLGMFLYFIKGTDESRKRLIRGYYKGR